MKKNNITTPSDIHFLELPKEEQEALIAFYEKRFHQLRHFQLSKNTRRFFNEQNPLLIRNEQGMFLHPSKKTETDIMILIYM